jgi:hypothetical protein
MRCFHTTESRSVKTTTSLTTDKLPKSTTRYACAAPDAPVMLQPA